MRVQALHCQHCRYVVLGHGDDPDEALCDAEAALAAHEDTEHPCGDCNELGHACDACLQDAEDDRRASEWKDG